MATGRARGGGTPTARVSVALGPFAGMRDRRPASAPADEAQYLAYMENVWVRDPLRPGGVELRPAFTRLAATPGARTAQGFAEILTASGLRTVFQAAGGKLYRLQSGAWSDVTPAAGVAVSSSARFVYLSQYNDKLVVSDGVNRPWYSSDFASGSPITGTYINFDAGSGVAAVGAPVVYGGKLFFIRADNQRKIVWSEEADQATGYEQTGYANYWQLTQTGVEPLTALAATNAALYLFRERSIAVIAGAVASDFSSTATEDAVVGNGTAAPATVRTHGSSVWFLDISGLPAVLDPGGGVRVLRDASETLLGLAPSVTPLAQSNAWARHSPDHGLILFAVPTALGTDQSYLLTYHADARVCQGVWRLPGNVGARAAAVYVSGTTPPENRLLVGDANGTTWYAVSDFTAANAGRDYDGAVYTAIPMRIETEPVLGSPSGEARWDGVAVAMRIPSESALAAPLARSFAVSHKVPRATWSTPLTPTATAQHDGANARAVVGILAQGRSAQFRVANSATAPGRFLLDAIGVEGTALPPNAVSY